MILPYRTRRFLRGLAITALSLVLVLIIAWLVWLLWLDRYVVYTRDGAVLDFNLSDQIEPGEIALPPEEDVTVSIYYNEGDNVLNISTELSQLAGYYIDGDMLEKEMSTVLSQLKKLPPQTPVLVEMKDIVGRFFFQTNLGPVRSSLDQNSMNELMRVLKLSDFYLIAKFPALRDYYYGLDHVNDGIFLKSGKGLWMDDSRCYWLNPQSEGTLSYIIQTVTELKQMGFNEVVLGDFAIPTSENIKFSGNRNEILSAAAKKILEACGTDRFAVSFCVASAGLTLPEGRTRLYIEDQSASDIKTLSEEAALTDPAVKLVFITDLNDTRFDDYGVLRPLNTAQLEED